MQEINIKKYPTKKAYGKDKYKNMPENEKNWLKLCQNKNYWEEIKK